MTVGGELKQQAMPNQQVSEEETRTALERLEQQNQGAASGSCSIRCKTATTDEADCECGCGGDNHGEIAETNQTLNEVRRLQ